MPVRRRLHARCHAQVCSVAALAEGPGPAPTPVAPRSPRVARPRRSWERCARAPCRARRAAGVVAPTGHGLMRMVVHGELCARAGTAGCCCRPRGAGGG